MRKDLLWKQEEHGADAGRGGVPLFICLSWCFSIPGLEDLATLVLEG